MSTTSEQTPAFDIISECRTTRYTYTESTRNIQVQYHSIGRMVVSFGDVFTVAQTVHSSLTKQQQRQAAWYESAYQLAQRTKLACNDKSQINDDRDEPYFDFRPYYDEFEDLQEQMRSLPAKTDVVSEDEVSWTELRRLENEIQQLLMRTSPKDHRPNQEMAQTVYDQSENVIEACEGAREELGIGTAIRDKLS